MKKTQWKEDLYISVKFARQKLCKNYTEVTPTTSVLRISAHFVYPFQKLGSFRRMDKALDIHLDNKTTWTTQYQEASLKYVEYEYCAKH